MSATPAFTATSRMGRAVLSAATTDRTGATTANIADILTGVAAGTQINELVVQADGNPADCVVLIFLHNGTDYRLFDEFDLGDPAAASTTLTGYREARQYANLWLPSGSWKVAAAITVVPTAGNVNVWASGADL